MTRQKCVSGGVAKIGKSSPGAMDSNGIKASSIPVYVLGH